MPPRLTRLRFVPAHACAVLAACTLLVTALPGNAETPPGDLPYVSGGIGEEELAVLRLVRGDYNLRLLFADQSGTYLSGIEARILDAHGKTVLQAAKREGWGKPGKTWLPGVDHLEG